LFPFIPQLILTDRKHFSEDNSRSIQLQTNGSPGMYKPIQHLYLNICC